MSDNSHLNIPRAIMESYTAHYDNRTYLAVREMVEHLSQANPVLGGAAWEHDVLNELIDSSFEREGAAFYAGSEQVLIQHITPAGESLIALCQQHLANFGTPPAPMQPTPDMLVHEEIDKLQKASEEVMRNASDLRSWRGRVAYHWVSATVFLLHAASAVLLESHYDSYPVEKLDRAVEHLRYGVQEAVLNKFRIGSDFATWLRNTVRARD